eukprot:Skav204617  [mRNA]  locus=scaffold1712:153964:164100:- [translate_table: standard]
MSELCRWLDSALRRERDEMAVRHHVLMEELHALLDNAELQMQRSKLEEVPMLAGEENPEKRGRSASQSSQRSSQRCGTKDTQAPRVPDDGPG